MKKKLLFFSVLLTLSAISALKAEESKENPVAAKEATVITGNARFTILTSRLIRMEWAKNGKFEDRASLGIINRHLPVPEYKVTSNKKKLVIKTDYLTLTYIPGEKFTEENLHVKFRMGKNSKENGSWYPGKDDSGNLLGTTRTLDQCDGFKTVEPYDPGVISRDGWAIIDESERHLFVSKDTDWGQWAEERDETERQDLYIFAYGHDYKSAVSDFTKIAGRIPLPPKYAFGYWWSRYWQYSDAEFIELGQQFRDLNIPIDIMVIDMDWHETWSLRGRNSVQDEFGQGIGWTGYTWQKDLFPNPANFLADIHNMGMKTSLNLHPASGIQPYENCYERFVNDYVARAESNRPAQMTMNEPPYDGPDGFVYTNGKKAPVPFRITDQNWADAYFNSVIHPLENMGVDFWWLDWQQWKYCKYMKGMNNTFWLNYTFFHDKIRQSVKDGMYAERPMIYHRWGGLGSHRYQIGFSGDTYDTWQVLGYLPYFTTTASNVGYGYWGHDIGGHMQQYEHFTDPELYMRWLQYGVFTPIYKTHSTKSNFLERRIWVFPEYFDYMKAAIRLRYSLSPYIYTAARQAYDTGICICRPMYYDYPENENSYTEKEQYMFGDKIMATVLCQPADSLTGLTERSMWFPEGNDWYDVATGALHKGGEHKTLHYTLAENPYYIKAGAIIPMASSKINSLQEKSNEINLFIAPGWNDSESNWYEDDGATQAYTNEFATTKVIKTATEDNGNGQGSVAIKIMPRKGNYRGMDPQRKINITLDGSFAPEQIFLNGEEITYSRFATHHSETDGFKTAEWTYDGKELAVKIYLPEQSADKTIDVECIYSPETVRKSPLIYGKKGLLKRMAILTPEMKLIVGRSPMALQLTPVDFLKVAQASSKITENPKDAIRILQELDLKAMVDAIRPLEAATETYINKIDMQSQVK